MKYVYVIAAIVALLAVSQAHAQAPNEATVIVPELAVDPVGYEERIVLEWQAPDGHSVSGFSIYRESEDGAVNLIDTVGPDVLTYAITGHTAGDIYSVQAFAFGPRSEGALPWCDDPTDEA